MTRGRSKDQRELHRRLEQARLALEATASVSPERIRAVFRKRASQWAADGGNRWTAQERIAAAASNQFPALVFSLGCERYAFKLGRVVQVFPRLPSTPVPGGPPHLLGISNFRGEVHSVIDLRHLLNVPQGDDPAPGYFLLIRTAAGELGVLIDDLDSVQQLAAEQLTSPSDGQTGAPAQYVQGITATNIIVLNADSLESLTS